MALYHVMFNGGDIGVNNHLHYNITSINSSKNDSSTKAPEGKVENRLEKMCALCIICWNV